MMKIKLGPSKLQRARLGMSLEENSLQFRLQNPESSIICQITRKDKEHLFREENR